MLKRLKSDTGNAVTILGLASILLIAAMGSLVFDFSKNVQLKSAYENAAQNAAQSAIIYIHPHGGLSSKSVETAFERYKENRKVIVGDSPFGYAGNKDKGNTKSYNISVTACPSGATYSPGNIDKRCITFNANGNTGGKPSKVFDERVFLANTYTDIIIDVEEHSNNMFMGILGDDFKSQKIPVVVRANKHYD